MEGDTMKTTVYSTHFKDSNGIPAGGMTYGTGFAIGWQNGPLGRGDERIAPNGAFVEDIISAAIDRLEYYQSSRFASPYNVQALVSLYAANAALAARTIDRENRDVEGTHEV